MRILWVALACLLSSPVYAFCGFYASSGGSSVFNNATQVVLMRDETKTVLSMQNNYQGPPEDFAMVIPVPVILKKEDVKTLEPAVFERLDTLDAPRLVEYWEQDPCRFDGVDPSSITQGRSFSSVASFLPGAAGSDYQVKIEAEFKVAEYEIVILSAKDSTGLNQWLTDNKYNIPPNADKVFKPYIEAGMKFFVAKVNPKKVKFKGDQAMLSPLRFAYDSETFFLPVRLGLLNSSGYQDLIIHILAKDRYESANYDNVTIPTNLDVTEAVKEEFAPFYASLFDEVVKKYPKSIVTEYAWQASTCDPCPVDPISAKDLITLGADLLPGTTYQEEITQQNNGSLNGNKWTITVNPDKTPTKKITATIDESALQGYFVLTRLHARYTKDSLGDDIIFRTASPIIGGREGTKDTGAKNADFNNFQGRYVIRHAWQGKLECQKPLRGIWGGPPENAANNVVKPARDLAFAKRGLSLASYLVSPSQQLIGYETYANITQDGTVPKANNTNSDVPKMSGRRARSCAVEPISDGGLGLFGLGLLLVVGLFWRRYSKKAH
jgi:hypothetical protein